MQRTFTGYYPGALGRITEVHAVYYHGNWGFDASFEIQVGRELAGFLEGFRASRDGLWLCLVDGGQPGKSARLRWFIVAPAHQGSGIGRELLQRAVSFCRGRGYDPVFLWTFRGLEAAGHLYESTGFVLQEEHPVDRWGARIREQRYQLSPAVR